MKTSKNYKVKVEIDHTDIPIYRMVGHFIMAISACIELVATGSKKLTVPLVVFATKG
jgi:hypothetical protein